MSDLDSLPYYDPTDAEQEVADRETVKSIDKGADAIRAQVQHMTHMLQMIAEDAHLRDVIDALSAIRAATDTISEALDGLE